MRQITFSAWRWVSLPSGRNVPSVAVEHADLVGGGDLGGVFVVIAHVGERRRCGVRGPGYGAQRQDTSDHGGQQPFGGHWRRSPLPNAGAADIASARLFPPRLGEPSPSIALTAL